VQPPMASRELRSRPSLHPGLCPRCHGAGVSGLQVHDLGATYCPACHGLGVLS
jgi:DnaJ-class molecular chaperone